MSDIQSRALEFLARLGEEQGAPPGYVRLYRAVANDEYAAWVSTGKLPLTTGEKFFTTDRAYIDRVQGKGQSGKQVFRGREAGNVITIDVPVTFFAGRLAKKGSPGMPKELSSLPSYHAGDADKIQVKHERGSVNLGFFLQASIDAMLTVAQASMALAIARGTGGKT